MLNSNNLMGKMYPVTEDGKYVKDIPITFVAHCSNYGGLIIGFENNNEVLKLISYPEVFEILKKGTENE